MSVLFYAFINEFGQIVENHTMTIISQLWPTKIYFCSDNCKSVQIFCLVKYLDQHKWWKLFPINIYWNVLSHIGMVRPFCWFRTIDCYRDHMFRWCCLIHAFTVSERFCMVVVPRFELLFRSSIVNKAVVGCCSCCWILSETLTIQWVVLFWSAITFTVVVVICFAQHFRTMLLDDVSNIGRAAIT